MWPFEEISGLFYALAKRNKRFVIESNDDEKFIGYAPEGIEVKEWAAIIQQRIEKEGLEQSLPSIADVHVALFIWQGYIGVSEDARAQLREEIIPHEHLMFSPILSELRGHQIQSPQTPRQILK